MSATLPYRIAVLCYLFDAQDRVLLLHRHKAPNRDLFSPIGGKLEQQIGESPTACALREIREETGLQLADGQLHLTGIVSEACYEDSGHWLMFLYEVKQRVTLQPQRCDEGLLNWYARPQIDKLSIPETDRRVIWPLFWENRGGFFMVHIHCEGGDLRWHVEQGREPKPASA